MEGGIRGSWNFNIVGLAQNGPLFGYTAVLCTLLLVLQLASTEAKLVQQTWVVTDTLVDYYSPSDQSLYSSQSPVTTFASGHSRWALVVNDTFPGPMLEVDLNDEVEILVINEATTADTTIHWHSMPQRGTPWADGTYMISQCPIQGNGGQYLYKFTADVPGTRFWHSHITYQMEWGLFGPLIIQDPNDPYKGSYDEEVVILFNEFWREPATLAAGSVTLIHSEHIDLVNGVFGNGTAEYPYHSFTVVPGKCYRFRFIAGMGEDQGFNMTVAGHSMDLIAVEGQYVQRQTVGSIVMYIASRYDVIICANQEPGDYLVEFTMVQLEEMLGQYSPAAQFGFLISYNATADSPQGLQPLQQNAPPPPPLILTNDVINISANSSVSIDVLKDPAAITPLFVTPLPPPNHDPVTFYLGVLTGGKSVKMYDWTQLGLASRLPLSPLLFTKGTCGVTDDTHIVALPNNTIVDIVINNLFDTTHPMHLHGQNFWVLGTGYKLRPNLSDSEIIVNPVPGMCQRGSNGTAASLAPSPGIGDPVIGDPNAPLPFSVWGCVYDDATDNSTLNFQDPYETDVVIVPAHSWAVVRVSFTNPGVWNFHCHKLYHNWKGMELWFNIGADVQPAIPADIPTGCGPCEAVNKSSYSQSDILLPILPNNLASSSSAPGPHLVLHEPLLPDYPSSSSPLPGDSPVSQPSAAEAPIGLLPIELLAAQSLPGDITVGPVNLP